MLREFHLGHPFPLNVKDESVMERNVCFLRMILIKIEWCPLTDATHFEGSVFIVVFNFVVRPVGDYKETEC